MRVLNVHARTLSVPPSDAGALLDTLASPDDRLWPAETWPAMRLDKPLGLDARGGHGPVRYSVAGYRRGRSVEFRFEAPAGFRGTHRFEVLDHPAGCELRHTLDMEAAWPAVLTWPLVYRSLHDALIEDALAKAQAMLGETPSIRPWSPYVRGLRWLLAGSRARPQADFGPSARGPRQGA